MGGFSLWHWVIVLIVVLLLFGRGRIADVMGDFGKGIKSFKQGMGEELGSKPAAPQAPAAQIPAPDVAAAAAETPAATTTTTPSGQ
mgnify:CR=1 FL=1